MSATDHFMLEQINADGKAQGVNSAGEVREFVLCVDASQADLNVYAARHYVDPASLAAFSGSEPWGGTEEDE